MEITLIKQPYTVSFSGNPMPFTFALSPYGSNERLINIAVVIRLQAETAYNSNSFSDIKVQTCLPDDAGLVQIDVNTIIHPYLNYYSPKLTLNTPVICNKQFIRYKILYYITVDNKPLGSIAESAIFNAIKGGMAIEQWHPTEFFTNIITANKQPLHFFLPTETITPTEYKWLYWIYPYADNNQQTIECKLFWEDGSTDTIAIANNLFTKQWNVCCTPIGITQILQAIIAAKNMLLVKYSIKIYTDANIIVAEQFFKVDYRNYTLPTQLIYRNSTGGLETIFIKAQTDFEVDFTVQQAQKVLPPAYFNNTILQAQNIEASIYKTNKFSGYTNYLSREEAERIADFFVSKEKYEVYENKLIHIIASPKNVKFFSNKENLISIQIDWQHSYLNQYFTPKNLMPITRSCPALTGFTVKQVNAYILQFMWSMPVPYEDILITVSIPNNAGGNDVFESVFSGNTKAVRQSFQNLTFSNTNNTITVTARVICDKQTNDLGPASTIVLTAHTQSGLIAVDDNYVIAAGYNSGVLLSGSVLLNDYDPDGQPITVIPAASTTNKNGSYSIDASGNITYTPPSSTFNGKDYFQYTIKDAANTRTATATAYISVGNTPSGVFAKIVLRNTVGYGGGGNSSSMSGEVWIDFFGDPAGTQPLDITSLGLTINYRQVEVNIDRDGNSTQNQSNLQITGTLSKVKIYEGELNSSDFDPSMGPFAQEYYINFIILTGTGYVGI